MAFSNEQLERYSRHIILKEVGAKGQKKLLKASLRLSRQRKQWRLSTPMLP